MQPKIPYACQKHDSPMDRRLSMNNRTIAIPFEPGLKGVSQENPTSFLWKNYTCWAWFGFCYLHFNISCGEVTYVAMATGNWNFPWFWSRTWQNMCYKTKKNNSDGILWSMPLTMVVYCIQNSLPLGWILLLVVTRNSSLAVMSNLPSLINIYFYYSFAWSKFFFSPLDLNYCCAECLPTIIFMVNVVWWIDEYWTLDSWDVPFIGCIC